MNEEVYKQMVEDIKKIIFKDYNPIDENDGLDKCSNIGGKKGDKRMSLQQLEQLQEEIRKNITAKKLDFWGKIETKLRYQELEDSVLYEARHFEENSQLFLKVKSLGFKIVVYAKNNVNFVNYSKDKIGDRHYRLFFSKEEGLKKCRPDVTDDDFNNIKKLIYGEMENNQTKKEIKE